MFKRRKWLGAGAAAAGVLLTLTMTTPAQASDWGGYANPANGCGGNYKVADTEVYTDTVQGSAGYVGKLQIKWSYGCPGNYARFEAAGGWRPSWIGISIHSQNPPYNKAGADEVNTTVAYTRVIQLANNSDVVCAYVDMYVMYKGQKTHAGKNLCA